MGVKVMVVDDERIFLDFAKFLLTSLGYEAVAVDGGVRALEEAKVHRPHLILMDLMMPEVDGLEALRRLKDDPATHDIPVIICSIIRDAAEIKDALAGGAFCFLPKPLEAASLRRKIQDALR